MNFDVLLTYQTPRYGLPVENYSIDGSILGMKIKSSMVRKSLGLKREISS